MMSPLIKPKEAKKLEKESPELNEDDVLAIQSLQESYTQIKDEIGRIIIGQEDAIEKIFICMLSQGHALLMGVPGLAKTLLVNSIAQAISLSFSRIQFTPDLMPSDVTGTEILQNREDGAGREFKFVKGPIFTNVLLADEINRTPPKTQSALLEAMQEKRVTVAGKNHILQKPFFVLATQNPIEQEGTYPLPEAQLDRFMFLIRLEYPNRDEELSIARNTTSGELPTLSKILTGKKMKEFQQLVEKIPVPEHVFERAVDLVRMTRPTNPEAPAWVNQSVQWGAGPRAIQFLVRGAKARAVIKGNFITTTEDLEAVAEAALDHRIITNFHARSEGISSADIVKRLIKEANQEES